MPQTLPSEYFCSRDVFDQETARIFHKSWLVVGRDQQLAPAGAFRSVQVEGHDILLVGSSDKPRGFHNTCRHRGTRLVNEPSGQLPSNCIICPYHSWKYALDGRLLAAPNMQPSDGFESTQHGLHTVPCDSWLGFTMVSLNRTPCQLPDTYHQLAQRFAAWQLDTLGCAARLEYDVRANWKLIMQNYSECYHCPSVHPTLHRLTNYRNSSNDLTEGPCLGGPMQLNSGCDSMSEDGQRVGQTLPALDDSQRRQVFYYVVWPNLLLSLHPDYVMAHQLHRVAVDQTRITCEFYFSSESMGQDDFSPDRAVAFWDEVNQQDWHVCELSQQGVASLGYQPGPYSPYESMLAAFDSYYLDQLG